MKPRVKLIVGLVIAAAAVLVLISLLRQGKWDLEHVLLWTAVCLVSELFWVKTPSGDSVQSLAATAKLSAILILDVWAALLTIFVSTVVGNFIFRRSKWYRAIYNGSQLMLAGAGAALVYQALGGIPFLNTFGLPGGERMEAVAGNLADRRFLSAFLLASITYIMLNNTLMAWLMSAMTGRRMTTLWKENCLYAEEVQSSLALVLLSPLLVMLYGTLGVAGLLILFACLALVHAANRRYLAVIRAQEDLLRSERMAAMGELAQEIGRSLGQYLSELKVCANRVFQRARHASGEKVSHSAEVIHINVGNMSALVDGLAAFSHQETHKVPTDLNELVRRTVDFVRPQNRFDGIHFKITPDPILPMVNIDPAQLQQVFINLLTNAADALAEVDRPVKKIFVETHYDPGTQRVRVAFSDNGPGVPEANLNRIFEPHFTTKVTGHGFGLSTAFRIAANHRGLIRATNIPGGGANFLIDLPNS